MTSEKIAGIARQWIGKNFRPGMPEQCANFVRDVFLEGGIKLPAASKPADWKQTSGMPQGPALANSLSGDEIGVYVAFANLKPGDIVTFANTYGTFPEGTITHVGIVSRPGYMVHRPTAARPVEEVPLSNWISQFAEGRHPRAYFEAEPKKDDGPEIKLFAHSGGFSLIVTEALQPGTYPVQGLDAAFQLGPRR